MKLYTNPASPFGRKCQVIARELGIKLEEINLSPFQDPNMRKVNPLGKIPALQLDDGSVLFDSPVICEYLDSIAPGPKLFPASGRRSGLRCCSRRSATVRSMR